MAGRLRDKSSGLEHVAADTAALVDDVIFMTGKEWNPTIGKGCLDRVKDARKALTKTPGDAKLQEEFEHSIAEATRYNEIKSRSSGYKHFAERERVLQEHRDFLAACRRSVEATSSPVVTRSASPTATTALLSRDARIAGLQNQVAGYQSIAREAVAKEIDAAGRIDTLTDGLADLESKAGHLRKPPAPPKKSSCCSFFSCCVSDDTVATPAPSSATGYTRIK